MLASGDFAYFVKQACAELGIQKVADSEDFQALEALKGRSQEELQKELRVEHTRLFWGPPPHLIANSEGIWRSIQAGNKRPPAIINQYSLAVQEFMKDCGVVPQPKYNDCVDYIDDECDFMSYLAMTEAFPEGVEGDPAARFEQFRTEHLMLWVPGFLDEVLEHATLATYKVLCAFLRQLIDIPLEA
jgi:TorA maturation chaperone TorD